MAKNMPMIKFVLLYTKDYLTYLSLEKSQFDQRRVSSNSFVSVILSSLYYFSHKIIYDKGLNSKLSDKEL